MGSTSDRSSALAVVLAVCRATALVAVGCMKAAINEVVHDVPTSQPRGLPRPCVSGRHSGANRYAGRLPSGAPGRTGTRCGPTQLRRDAYLVVQAFLKRRGLRYRRFCESGVLHPHDVRSCGSVLR